ncbi:hypothetical protein PV11_09828 [Exophiala sideris]|uniref:Uncharacterized protein n=1 Tax=Exophiala sideris TaxID=1016849 RepID=A0A0D1WSL8_9EURO|nr:hypothetical protein PV11_09828 [Exophiala sideris]
MTRRKRTPSPSASQKRVAFEIPASLQQFSTISRSLATDVESHTPTTSQNNNTQAQPRPNTQPSSQSRRPYTPPTTFVPHKRSFPEAQPWPQPVPKANAYSAVARHIAENSPTQPVPSINTSSATVKPVTQPRSTSNPTRVRSPANEPVLKPGETPTLKSHPNLIASLVAKKRAENEAIGFRERWARKQAEYRLSKSPANQLKNELTTEAARRDGKQSQSKSVSNPLPARSVPPASTAKPSTPVMHEVQTPAAETVSTPSTDDSGTEKEVSKDQRPNDSDSLFGSPYSSPIVEFLERATDDAGLRDATEPNTMTVSRTSVTSKSIPHNREHQPASGLQPHGPSKLSESSSIPPLFSDKPMASQQRPQTHQTSQHTQQNMPNNSPSLMPRQTALDVSMSVQNPGNQAPAYGTQARLAPSQPRMPTSSPWYPGNQGVPAFYTQYYNSANNMTSTPTSSSGSPNFGTPQGYGKSPSPSGMTYPGYQMGVNPYMLQPTPPPGPIPTYGTTMAAAAVQQSKVPGAVFMTAMDLVAGINTKFKIATKDGFAVPKRY